MYLKRNTATDEFFRRFRNFINNVDEVHEQNIDDFINNQFNCIRVCLVKINEKENKQLLKDKYSEKSQKVVQYFIILS